MSYILNYTKWNSLFEQEATNQAIQANPIGSTGIYLAIVEGESKSYSSSAKPGVPHIIASGMNIKFETYSANAGTSTISFYKEGTDAKYNGIWKESSDTSGAITRSNVYQPSAGALDVAKALSVLSEITLNLFKSIDEALILKVLRAISTVSTQQAIQIRKNELFLRWVEILRSAKLMKSEELSKVAGGVANLEQIKRALQKL